MKIRGPIVAAVVFLILSVILYWSGHREPANNTAQISADTPPVILKLDESAITKLNLKRKDGEPLVLAKEDSGKWQITEPKLLGADQSTVSGIVSTLASLNSERLVEDKAAGLRQYGLDQPGLELDITEKNSKTQKLLIGDDTPASGAVYVMLAGDPRVFTMSKYSKTSVDKSLNDVRDKRLLTVNADKISRIELINKRKNQEIEFGRDNGEWKIVKPQSLRADSVQVSELTRKLADAKIDLSGSASMDDAAAFVRATPIAIVKVTDESGTQELQVRKSQVGKDKYYAKSTAVDGAYRIDSDSGQAVDKGLDDFRNKKLFDFGDNEPNKIELRDGSKTYFLTRNGEDWWSGNGKKMDAVSVQSLISKLRDLNANKFLDSGFAQPAIDASVVSDDGKRREKVQLAKSSGGYVARRENESALYQLSSSSVAELQKAAEQIKAAAAPDK
jgi:Domain of unknown function (DUF4340)